MSGNDSSPEGEDGTESPTFERDLLVYTSSPNEPLVTPPPFDYTVSPNCPKPETPENIFAESFEGLLPQNSDFQTERNRLTEKVCNVVKKITVSKPSKTKLKLKINRVTLTASWKWRDSKDDDACGICRGAFEACCTNCKMPGDDCPLALGDCKHPFHLHCINKWADSQPKPSCPLCRTEWKSVAAPTNRSPAYPQSPRNNSVSPGPVVINNNSASPVIFAAERSPTYNLHSPRFNPMEHD
uniref:Anaphase-promoting complex subunit 11 n=2 Tax=Panagrolaimus superbus TaxID=310955 RepID=A0A914YGQ8_9BILA